MATKKRTSAKTKRTARPAAARSAAPAVKRVAAAVQSPASNPNVMGMVLVFTLLAIIFDVMAVWRYW